MKSDFICDDAAPTITSVEVGPLRNNVYFVSDAQRRTLLIDAADEADRVVAAGSAAGHVELIVTTHRHPDHWRALADVHNRLGAPTATGIHDAPFIDPPNDRLLADGEVLVIGAMTFDVIELVGHTPGSIALALRPQTSTEPVRLFTGDSLFPGGVGKTWRPEDFDSLIRDVSEKLFDRYPDDAVVYPGHGAPTTLGAERPHLPSWRERRW